MPARKRPERRIPKPFSMMPANSLVTRSIKIMEEYLKISGRPNSLFSPKNSNSLRENLLAHYKKRFNHWENDKESEIFTSKDIIYYCTTYSDYFAFDIISGRTIGKAVLENDWLQTIDVEPAYQKKGIGTNLIKAITKTIGKKFHIPSKGVLGEHSYYLTYEGSRLINRCLDKKIILQEQCMLDVPPRTPEKPPRHY
jgi:GNAT superfamily N-acetyltransferase